jgi:hypothetical protein
MPEVMEVQSFSADGLNCVRPGRHLVEVAAAKRAALSTREDQRRRSRGDEAGHDSGRTVTIVSNNSGHAISQYLAAHDLPAHVVRIIGRDDSARNG